MCETLEKNQVAKKVLKADISDKSTIRMIVEIVKNDLHGKTLDAIIGGPPCQGFSTAGWWDQNDPRNNLFRPFLQIVDELRPRYVLIENVPGIMWFRGGSILKKIREILQEMGYKTEVALLKSEEYGVPQKRRRVFILGYEEGEPVHFPPEPLFADDNRAKLCSHGVIVLPRAFTVRESISDLPPLEPGGGAEVIDYDESWIKSGYQSWVRGLIDFEDLYKICLDSI